MAKVDMKMPEDFLLKISKLGSNFDSVADTVLQAGGEVVLKRVKSNLSSVIGRGTKFKSRATGELEGALGLSPSKLNRDGICDFFGIHSPSKEMAWVGEMLVKGLAGSIDDNGDEAVKAAEGMAEDINGVMGDLAHDMQTALPTDFDVNGSVRTAVDGVTGKAASAFTIALNITNFNNYSSEDIRQLTNEVMETANQFAQRKGVVFA